MSPSLPSGPVFISYRASDGTSIARSLARVLRASGVPVWLDETDLPPGDINRRLGEALSSGLSGGVLVITPDVKDSTCIRTLEAPQLLALASDPGFALAVVNGVSLPGSTDLDRAAPAALLGQDPAVINQIKQFRAEADPLSGDGLRVLGRWMALSRISRVRIGRGAEPFTIDVQSRAPASAKASDGELVFRTVPPPTGRLPDHDVWEDLQAFLGAVPRALGDAGVNRVLLRGGSHLSMAFSLGSTLPITTPYEIEVAPTNGLMWRPLDSAMPAQGGGLRWVALGLVGRLNRGRKLAVFIDFNETPEDGAFERHLQREPGRFRSHRIVRRDRLTAETGPAAVASAATEVRRIAAGQATSQVDLFLRTPWPAAVLLGRALNTLQLNLYEWSRLDGRGHYSPVVAVASGESASPIQRILEGV